MLEFLCSTCGKRVQGANSFAGKFVLCPVCKAAMTAPALADSSTANAAQAKVNQPSGAFSEGLPPLQDAPLPLTRGEVPRVLGGWVPYIIIGGIAVVAIALIIPALQKTRDAAARTQSIMNLKRIVWSIQGFHDANKRLPYNGTKPAAPNDSTSGSWAFMILPYQGNNPVYSEKNTSIGVDFLMCPGRRRPILCSGVGGPGAWSDYFINPFLNDPNGVANAPDARRTMIDITDGTSNTIFVGHGQIKPNDYASTDAIPGFTATIFAGGSAAMCRGNTVVVNGRDDADSQPGNWGGPFPQGSLMGMGDGTVRLFPYTYTGGIIANGICTGARPEAIEAVCSSAIFGDFLTPTGGEVVVIPDS